MDSPVCLQPRGDGRERRLVSVLHEAQRHDDGVHYSRLVFVGGQAFDHVAKTVLIDYSLRNLFAYFRKNNLNKNYGLP